MDDLLLAISAAGFLMGGYFAGRTHEQMIRFYGGIREWWNYSDEEFS